MARATGSESEVQSKIVFYPVGGMVYLKYFENIVYDATRIFSNVKMLLNERFCPTPINIHINR